MFPILAILHACTEDLGSDYVLKPPKEFDPLPPSGVVAPPSPGRAEAEMMRRVVLGVHQAHFVGGVEL